MQVAWSGQISPLLCTRLDENEACKGNITSLRTVIFSSCSVLKPALSHNCNTKIFSDNLGIKRGHGLNAALTRSVALCDF
jgi:hypothetical protein